MELRQIEYFMAVAAHQNFSRAAEHVHVSQPSLSIQIGGLEKELGTRLFDRLGRQVLLTEAGRLLLPRAKQMLAEADAARARGLAEAEIILKKGLAEAEAMAEAS